MDPAVEAVEAVEDDQVIDGQVVDGQVVDENKVDDQDDEQSTADIISQHNVEEGKDDEPEPEAKVEPEAGKEVEPEPEPEPAPEAGIELSDEDKEIFKDAPEKTQERFSALLGSVKEISAERDTYRQKAESVEPFAKNMIDAQISPQDVAEFIQMKTAVVLGNPEVAMEMLDKQRASLAKAYGLDVEGVDVLADFPDLAKGVQELEISRESALEIAKLRTNKMRGEQHQADQNQATAEQQKVMEVVNASRQSVFSMVQDWNSKDPDFGTIREDMAKYAMDVEQKYHPSLWPELIKTQYNQLKGFASKMAKKEDPKVIETLRPGSGGGGVPVEGKLTTADIVRRGQPGG